MGWIGCDLDETLVLYEEGMAEAYLIGKPIPSMVRRIKRHLELGDEVRIFTARVNVIPGWDHEGQRKLIEDWTVKTFGQKLVVTNVKDFGMIFCYDDRNVAVQPRTGKLLSKPPRIRR